MIVAPYSTDAPLYHLPITTGLLVLVNVVVFFATTFQLVLGNVEEDAIAWLILEFDTINPLQWITGAFMHGDFMHLIGNMFFLWAFGLVVEGKIGSLVFLALYMAIAAVDGAAVQLPMYLFGVEGGALGASGVIFALMVIAMLWAPENEMECFYFVGFYFGTFEIRIVKLCGAFMMLQMIFLWLGGFQMSSELLHVIGAAIGFPVGVWMLRQNLVDCEGWDFISRNEWLQNYSVFCSTEQRKRIEHKEHSDIDPVRAALAIEGADTARNVSTLAGPKPKLKKAALKSELESSGAKRGFFGGKKPDLHAPMPEQVPDLSLHPEFNRLVFLLRQAITAKSVALGQQHFYRLEELNLVRGVSDKVLMAYVTMLAGEKKWMEAIRPLMIVASRDGESANQARLRIGQIQLKVNRDPKAAASALARIAVSPGETTAENQKLIAMRDALLAEATG